MSFYRMLASHYDDIFKVSDAEIELLMENIPERQSRILDVACGTGQYSLRLLQKGYTSISAFDLDADMIALAKKKTDRIAFKTGDMLRLEELYDSKFDMIFCIGNSLVHLKDNGEVSEFVSSAMDKLLPGGRLIIQTINFDRIYAKGIDSLPVIEKDAVRFERKYMLYPDKVLFKGILTDKTGSYQESTKLLPLMHTDLLGMLNRKEAASISVYGDFSRSPYDPKTSYSAIFVAEKQSTQP